MKKVLLVEDDLQLVRMYQVIFKNAGIDLAIALDGEEGLKKVKEIAPDLILLDIVMPKKDGIAVLSELKADPKYKAIPVFCLTVLVQEENETKAKNLGAEEYLIKLDVSPRQLVEKVRSRLSAGAVS